MQFRVVPTSRQADRPPRREKQQTNKPGACCVRLTPTSLRQFFREPTISEIHALRPCSMRRFWMLARHCGQRWFCRKHCAAQPRHSGWLHGSITGSSRMLRRSKRPEKRENTETADGGCCAGDLAGG